MLALPRHIAWRRASHAVSGGLRRAVPVTQRTETPPGPLCLAGPTASGKTAAALAIAEALAPACPVEIVSVDSALVYRGLDIGTAKPSPAERARVPHHLIDILEPNAIYSAARFAADAARLIDAIAARGAVPLLVGGTMLYFKALFDGLDPMPAADPRVRAELAAELAADGLPALHRELQRVDPASATRLPPGDRQRILRALEVARVSGRPWSAFLAGRPARSIWPPLIALEPDDRALLHRRIEARFAAMLDAGFIDEVRGLRARGDLHLDLPALRSVGYRQAWEALDGGEPIDPGALAERAGAATRQLAKRQLTWLRGLPERHRIACDRPDAIDAVVALARRLVLGHAAAPS